MCQTILLTVWCARAEQLKTPCDKPLRVAAFSKRKCETVMLAARSVIRQYLCQPYCLRQCCGSESMWIRIDFRRPDPDLGGQK